MPNSDEALAFELGLRQSAPNKQLCAEVIRRNSKRYLETKSGIGLLVNPSAVIQVFRADVRSWRNQRGELKIRSQLQGNASYSEAFVLPDYEAIVVSPKAFGDWKKMKSVRWAARHYNIPVVLINRGNLEREV